MYQDTNMPAYLPYSQNDVPYFQNDVLMANEVAETAHFEGGTQIWSTRTDRGLLEPRGSKLTPLKSTFNAENFICRSSWSVSSDFGAVHFWNVCRSLQSQKKITKTFLRFKVVQRHQCWYHRKTRQRCLLLWATSMCLSATVLTLDKLIVVK